MHTDKEIYRLMDADPELLRLLCGGLSVARPYQFDAVELKALARRIDGVVRPADADAPIWIIEVQGWRDPSIYARLLIEIGLLAERDPQREVRGLLLFITPAHDPRTPPWHDMIERLPDGPIRRVYLIEVLRQLQQEQPEHPLLATFLPYLTEDRAQLQEQAPLAYRHLRSAPLPELVRQRCIEVFESWLFARFDDLSSEEILTMIGNLPPLEQTRAYKEIVAKARPALLAEGEKAGRQQEAAHLAQRLLQRRLGALDAERRERILALTLEPLEDLSVALLDFSGLDDLDAWLAGQEPAAGDQTH